MAWKKVVGGVAFVFGAFLLAGASYGITGNVVNETTGGVGSVLGILLVLGGIVLALGK